MVERRGILGSLEHGLCFLPTLNHYIKILPSPLASRDASERISSERISSYGEVRHGAK